MNARYGPSDSSPEARAARNVPRNPRPLCRAFTPKPAPAAFWCTTCGWNEPMHDDEAERTAIAAELARQTAEAWNAAHPVGTRVAVYPGARDDAPLITQTRTPAWTLGHGEPVVSVDGYAGGIALTHVDPVAQVAA